MDWAYYQRIFRLEILLDSYTVEVVSWDLWPIPAASSGKLTKEKHNAWVTIQAKLVSAEEMMWPWNKELLKLDRDVFDSQIGCLDARPRKRDNDAAHLVFKSGYRSTEKVQWRILTTYKSSFDYCVGIHIFGGSQAYCLQVSIWSEVNFQSRRCQWDLCALATFVVQQYIWGRTKRACLEPSCWGCIVT